MEKEAFEILKKTEGSWWHYGRKEAAGVALTVAGVVRNGTVLDAGAGYGSMFEVLSQFGVVDATEPEEEAGLVCKERGYRQFFKTEGEAIQKGMSYSLIGAFDVIEHVDDDYTFVQNLHTLTQKEGLLVATVPAFQFLWSIHDVHHMHFRRHTTTSMRKLLESAGYEIVYVRYWNCFLFPVAVCMRLLGKTGESGLSPHPFVAAILKNMLWCEARIVRFIPIPFGLSVVIVGKKK